MKWSVVVLLVLGLVAAVCAALLVVSLRSGGGGEGGVPVSTSGEVREGSYFVAARDLPSRTVVANDAVEIKTAPSKDVPANSFSQAAEVVGQVLRKPVKKGQLFDRSCFSSEGMGIVLAGTLQDGKRAVSVPLADSGGVEALLYPGCLVDVLAVMQLKDDEGLGDQPMSMTLLQGITVLAVGDQNIVTKPPEEESKGLVGKAPRSTVVLLVDSKQAEMLYLARQRGSVSIALRNPMDSAANGSQGTRLPNLSTVFKDAEERSLKRLDVRHKEAEQELERQRTKATYDMERAKYDIERARKEAEIAKIELDKKKLETERAAEQTVKPQWETRVVRGGVEEVKKFDMPEGKRDR